MRKLLALLFVLPILALALASSFQAAAAATGDDDGFIWVDANTKIRIKPIGKSAAGGATSAPQPRKDEKHDPKKEEPRK